MRTSAVGSVGKVCLEPVRRDPFVLRRGRHVVAVYGSQVIVISERRFIFSAFKVQHHRSFHHRVFHFAIHFAEGYYLTGRDFELAELKLLVDAVQSSRFITQKKSDALIKKIEKLTDRHEARQLQRQVVVADRIKTMNESIYYNVDKLHTAISEDRQIIFRYFEWTVSKEIRLKKDGENYHVSPWALTWDNENYYLIGYDMDAGILKHFRVDRMLHIGILNIRREGREEFSRFDLARYTRQTFGMFGGNEQMVRLRFHNKYVGVVIDRFGKNVPLRPDGDDHFIARINVAVSEQFYGWLTGLGRDAQILSPEAVVKEYKDLLEDLGEMYK